MTDRLDDIESCIDIHHGAYPDDTHWLIAELRETRRLGNQLANALNTIRTAPITGSPDWPIEDWNAAVIQTDEALAAWRSHQAKDGQ